MPAGLVFGQHKRHFYNYIMYSRALSSLYVGLGIAIGSSALDTNSTWAIYSDSACQQSVDTIVGQDGFPDGVCTNIPNTAANYGDYKGFEFIHLDSGCAPTIYQADTTSDSCSGYPRIAEIGTCYNTSWHYYSIDNCDNITSSGTSSTASASSTSSTSASVTASSSSNSGVAVGAVAGAVVGCVLGLALIAAVCAYFFWFRPRQQKRKRQNGAAAREAQTGEAAKEDQTKPSEMHQQPPELPSPVETSELAGPTMVEAPGDKGGYELHPESYPVELPGDHVYHSASDRSSYEDGVRRG